MYEKVEENEKTRKIKDCGVALVEGGDHHKARASVFF